MPIEAEIRKQITKFGYINISTMMALCLSSLEYSYYKTKDAIADTTNQNDFLTSPSISQMFGETISLWCIETWQKLGSPNNFNLIEFGAGDGSLLFDILRTTQKICPQFYSAANVKIIDINEKLIQKQKAKLENHLYFSQPNSHQTNSAHSSMHNSTYDKISWYKSFSELKNQINTNNQNQNQPPNTSTNPSILIANEFFDALPINQYVKIGSIWSEVILTIDEITKQLKFDSIQLTEKYSTILNSEHPNSIDGSVYEESEESINLIKEIANFFSESSSSLSTSSPSSELSTSPSSSPSSPHSPHYFASQNYSNAHPFTKPKSNLFSFLIIDYAYEIPNYTRVPIQYKSTLQAIKAHKYTSILSTLGEADLSAHVNFYKLKEVAKQYFLKTDGSIPQSEFLKNYGIDLRKYSLIKQNSQNIELTNLINAQYDRLVNKMGSLFKCLIINNLQ